MTTDREKRLEDALAQFLKPMKGIPFEVVIKSLCGTSVAKFDPTIDKNKETLALLVEALLAAHHAMPGESCALVDWWQGERK